MLLQTFGIFLLLFIEVATDTTNLAPDCWSKNMKIVLHQRSFE